MSRLAVVMFDLDGTLVYHEGAARQGAVRWLTGGESLCVRLM